MLSTFVSAGTLQSCLNGCACETIMQRTPTWGSALLEYDRPTLAIAYISGFYRATLSIAQAVLAVVVRLSVCHTHVLYRNGYRLSTSTFPRPGSSMVQFSHTIYEILTEIRILGHNRYIGALHSSFFEPLLWTLDSCDTTIFAFAVL